MPRANSASHGQSEFPAYLGPTLLLLSTFILLTSSSSPSVRAAWCDPEAREQKDLELELKGFTVSLT